MNTATERDIQEPWSGWTVDTMYYGEVSKIDMPELPLIRKCRDRS